jgi:hypothetical protein
MTTLVHHHGGNTHGGQSRSKLTGIQDHGTDIDAARVQAAAELVDSSLGTSPQVSGGDVQNP